VITLLLTFMIATQGVPPAPEAPAPRPVTLPMYLTIEGGAKLPASASGRAPALRLEPVAGGTALQAVLGSAGIILPMTSSGTIDQYRVRVENLPEGYVVKSMTFDSKDLTREPLSVSADQRMAVLAGPLQIPTYTGEGELQRVVDGLAKPRLGILITLAPR
jgi:hypothetical protein